MSKKIMLAGCVLAALFCSVQMGAAASASPATAAAQQPGRVSGVVSDKMGPVAGASIQVKGTKTGVATDLDGNFTITGVNVGDILVISYVGYSSQEIKYTGQPSISVVFDDTLALDEVIFVAYGSTKKGSFSGSASVVKSDQIEKLNGSGFDSALQGMSAGVQVTNFSSSPGSEARIQIRGISSMSGSSNPLYIVDGMPFDGGLNSINPSDIASITVLKDAAASSLYGSRAANGVVIITTKKGGAANGKAKINFRGAWGTSDLAIANPKTIADPKQTLLYNWEALYNDYVYVDGMSKAEAEQKASSMVVSNTLRPVGKVNGINQYVSPFKNGVDDSQWVLSKDGVPYINPSLQYAWDPDDWDKYGAAYTHKIRQDYGVDVSGTTDSGKTSYYLSAGYLNDNGYLLSQYYKRYTFKASVTTQVTDWLQVGGSLTHTYFRQNNGGIWGANRAIIYSTSLASPWLRNVDNTDWCVSEKTGKRMYSFGDYQNGGFFGYHFMTGNGDYWDNYNDESFSNTDGHYTSARYFMDFTLPCSIKFRSSVNLDTNLSTGYEYGSAIHDTDQVAPWGVTVRPTGGSASRTNNQFISYTWNNVLSWEKSFDNHNIDLMAGQEAYRYTSSYNSTGGEGIMELGLYEVDNTTRDWNYYYGSGMDQYALLSFFGKAEYNYAGKYYVSGSFRRDGSSRFSPQNRWGNFYSVGGSWRISNEEFMKNISWLDNLVLRASYGTSGNDKLLIRNSSGASGGEVLYAYQGRYEADNLFGIPGLRPSQLATPDLKWESNKQFNVAADFSIFNNITATIEYYSRRSDDLLYSKEIPYSARSGGVSGTNMNIGSLRNSGLEFTVSATPVRTANFTWKIDANASTLKNEIVKLPSEPFFWARSLCDYYFAEGNSLYDIYTCKTDGIDPQTGLVRYVKADGSITNKATEISQADYQKVGSTLPKVYGSVTNSFDFYNFDFSFMFYFSAGGYMYDQQYWERTRVRHQTSPLADLVESRWQKPGDVTSIPRFTESYWGTYMTGHCDRYVFKNDYLRLRNVTLGYSVPATAVKKAGISNLRFYVSADNLLTLGACVKRYAEPEGALNGNNYNGNSETDSGLPGGRRLFMGGVQISF